MKYAHKTDLRAKRVKKMKLKRHYGGTLSNVHKKLETTRGLRGIARAMLRKAVPRHPPH